MYVLYVSAPFFVLWVAFDILQFDSAYWRLIRGHNQLIRVIHTPLSPRMSQSGSNPGQ